MASVAVDKNIVIVGGGIMGCSTAYHLTKLGSSCTLIERTSIACAASGKAGGFLARYCICQTNLMSCVALCLHYYLCSFIFTVIY